MTRKLTNKFYGYGIVGKSGAPWWNESCVCEDRDPLDEQVESLNDPMYADDDNTDHPYRVVKLFYIARVKR